MISENDELYEGNKQSEVIFEAWVPWKGNPHDKFKIYVITKDRGGTTSFSCLISIENDY